jgi:hypothetical protein
MSGLGKSVSLKLRLTSQFDPGRNHGCDDEGEQKGQQHSHRQLSSQADFQ